VKNNRPNTKLRRPNTKLRIKLYQTVSLETKFNAFDSWQRQFDITYKNVSLEG